MDSFQNQYRVYYEDTDAQGVMYYANYLKFMERCRCEWLDQLGFDVVSIQQNYDLMFVVREVNLKYESPAKLFETLTVTCSALQVGKVKLLVEQKIYNQSQLLCSATIKLATLHKTSFKLTAMPDVLVAALEQT